MAFERVPIGIIITLGQQLLFLTFSVLVANPKKTTLHGGQSRSWSAILSGRRPTVILYISINRHAGTPNKQNIVLQAVHRDFSSCHLFAACFYFTQCCCLKRNLNAFRPSEHPPVRKKKSKHLGGIFFYFFFHLIPISPLFTPYNFLSRCKFSTFTTRQPMVEFYLLTFPRFP